MINNLFFELIQVAIGHRESLSRVPSAKEWQTLYAIAVKQAVAGVCFCGVQRLPKKQLVEMPVPLKLQWFALAESVKKRNVVMNQRCVEIQDILARSGFRNFIMKGQGVATLYCNDDSTETRFREVQKVSEGLNDCRNLGLYRQSGDIDVYVEGGYKKVMEYVNRTFPTKEGNELEIHYHCFNDAEVEIHFRPFSLRNPIMNRRLQRFFNEECEVCFSNSIPMSTGGEITVPTFRFNLVHQLVHIFHHLFTEGIGLRQLMDYYFVLKASPQPSSEREGELSLIMSMGMQRFAGAVMWVMQEVFGLERDRLLCEPEEKGGRMVLKEVMHRGNFGKMADDKINLDNLWTSFWYINSKAIRFIRFEPWAWFWTPITRIFYYVWRKVNGFK